VGWSEEVGFGRALGLHTYDGQGLSLLAFCWARALNRLVTLPPLRPCTYGPSSVWLGVEVVENVYGRRISRLGEIGADAASFASRSVAGVEELRMPTTTKTVNYWTGKAGIGTDLRA